MKRVFLIFAILTCSISFSQNNFTYNFTVNTTFTANENFGEYDAYFDEVDWSIIAPRALMLRSGIDVNIVKRITAGINLGFDWHPDLEVLAVPYYLDSKFSIVQVDDDKLYLRIGIGKLLKLSQAFERGTYNVFGIGYHISTIKNFNIIVNMDFHQKKIAHFENGRLNSLSFGMGMSFL